jgi:outer membrane protein assembly factor BamE (lipoprotein component of BamABCDE complex)
VKRRTRIRLLIYLLLVLAVVAVVVFARRLDVNDRVSKENFDRIADGMTQAEVEGILGSPTAIETFHNKDEGRLGKPHIQRITGYTCES